MQVKTHRTKVCGSDFVKVCTYGRSCSVSLTAIFFNKCLLIKKNSHLASLDNYELIEYMTKPNKPSKNRDRLIN